MDDYEKAYWLADKIPAYGDYAKEAAAVLKRQADRIRKLDAENEILSNRCDIYEQEAQRMRETIAALHKQQGEPVDECEKMRFALENCRLLAARHRKEDWALLILGFCAEGGVVGSVTR